MTEYLITIPGDEAVWDARTDDDRRVVGEAHRAFVAASSARGHRVGAGGELTPLARPRSYVVPTAARCHRRPYAESAEQAGGFYLVESDDLDDLLAIVGELARTEPVVEVRPIHGRTSGVPS